MHWALSLVPCHSRHAFALQEADAAVHGTQGSAERDDALLAEGAALTPRPGAASTEPQLVLGPVCGSLLLAEVDLCTPT